MSLELLLNYSSPYYVIRTHFELLIIQIYQPGDHIPSGIFHAHGQTADAENSNSDDSRISENGATWPQESPEGGHIPCQKGPHNNIFFDNSTIMIIGGTVVLLLLEKGPTPFRIA